MESVTKYRIWFAYQSFTGMKGYYTEEFLIGVIFAGEKDLRLIKTPPVLAEGEKGGSIKAVTKKRVHDYRDSK